MTDVRSWPAAATWLVLPFAAGPALADALQPRSAAVRGVATVLLWAGWATGLVAALVPRTLSLTVLRTLVPAALVAVGWAALAGGRADASDVVAVVSAALALAAAFSPLTGDVFIDGSSYGPERRLALRAPSALLFGPVELSWAATVAGITAGPLLLAAEQWVAGGAALVVGLPVASAGLRSLHQLARRWIVFVPAGVVLHDPIGQPEPTLFLRRGISRLAPARRDSTALDLTQGSPGLAVQLELTEPISMLIRRGVRRTETVEVESLLFTPTRPGALLEEAARRRIAVRSAPDAPR